MKKVKTVIKKIFQFIANPKLLLCFGIAWLITNGWSYIMFGIGSYYEIKWMIAVAGGYLAFLWLPISPEKIVTVIIAIGLLRLIFPNDKKTLGILKDLYTKYKIKRKDKKQSGTEQKKDNEAESLIGEEGIAKGSQDNGDK